MSEQILIQENREESELQKLKEKFKEWLYLEDDIFIDVELAVAISEGVGGDPLWIFIVAPPGSAKSETLRCFSDPNYFYQLSDLTSNSFISGYKYKIKFKEGERGITETKSKDLLPQLNKKILIVKDFTVILDKNDNERREILAQLREIYDGKYARFVGTENRKIEYESRFGLLAGVTPIIDKQWKPMQQLGERFLKIRLNQDIEKATERAYRNEGNEEKMREELNNAVNEFIESIEIVDIIIPERYEVKFENLAKFVAYARTPVMIKTHPNDSEFYFDYVPMPEIPTRLVKQLKKLGICLALIHNKDEIDDEIIDIVKRVAFDTIPLDRLEVLKAIGNGVFINEITKNVRLPEASIRKLLSILELLDLIREETHGEDSVGRPLIMYKKAEWIINL
ncbi:MAG: hypothetical protein AABY32_02785 [Nanoarchaeota archaeon]